MGYWITDYKTGDLYYQVNKRLKIEWKFFNKEKLDILLKSKEISRIDYIEALFDL